MAFKGRTKEDLVDYRTLRSTLIDSGLQRDNPALFQVVNFLITGTQNSKDSLGNKFGKEDKLGVKQLEGIVPIENGGSFAGQYLPILTIVSNLSNAGAFDFYYTRVANLVHVFGYIAITITAVGVLTRLRISLPILSYFDFNSECVGVAHSESVAQGAAVTADITNKSAELRFLSTVNGPINMSLQFSYKVVPQ